MLIPKDILQKLYIERELTAKQIGRIFGKDKHTICRQLRTYGLLRSKSEVLVLRWRERRKLPEPEQVRHLYWDKGLNLREIGEIFNSAPTNVYDYMKNHNIPCRPNRGGNGGAHAYRPSNFLGKHHTEETNKKNREAHIGKPSPMRGRHQSEEAIKKTAEANRGRTPWWIMRGLPNPCNIEAALKGHYYTKPTKPERILIKIIEEYRLPFKYVGNGQVILGGLNPDFINVNGKKQIIEVFGDYWHRRPNLKYHQSEEGRKNVYSQFGYNTMILWEDEICSAKANDIAKKLVQFEGATV